MKLNRKRISIIKDFDTRPYTLLFGIEKNLLRKLNHQLTMLLLLISIVQLNEIKNKVMNGTSTLPTRGDDRHSLTI